MPDTQKKTVITPKTVDFSASLKEVIQYKDLFWILSYRDLRVRYAQTSLGFIWAFFKPLMTLLVYTFVFNRVAGLNTGDIPYMVYAFSGLMIWNFISQTLTGTSTALKSSANMLKKIYFPRVILLGSKYLTTAVDLGISFLIFACLLIYYQIPLQPTFFLFPLYLLLIGLFCGAVGMFFSGMSIRYQDFLNILPLFLQIGNYLSPIAYPINLVPEHILPYYMLNPITCLIVGVRYSLFGGSIDWAYQVYLVVFTLVLAIVGYIYFYKAQKKAADIL